MQLDSDVYRLLYEKLWEEFFNREWPSRKPKPKTYGQGLWYVRDASGEFISIKKMLSQSGHHDERHFWRKYNDLKKPEYFEKINVNDIAICAALEYMGFEVADGTGDKNNLFAKTKSLLNQFTEMYLSGKPMQVSADDKFYETQASVAANTNQQEEVTTLPNMDKISNVIEEKVKSAITSFYENIGSGAYETAWNLLTPEFQNRMPWQGDASRFVAGFTNTVGINGIYVFNAEQQSPTVVKAQVYFDDNIEAYGSPELGALNSMTVADLDYFVQNVTRMHKKVEDAGGQNFENIELSKLFEQAASEYIWYKCGIKPSEISKAFGSRRTIIVKRLYYCSCKLINDQWFINSIRGVMPQSVR